MKGRTAVITGGGSGIGAAAGRRLAAAGASVVLVGRRKERLDAVAKEIGTNARAVVEWAGGLTRGIRGIGKVASRKAGAIITSVAARALKRPLMSVQGL